MSRSRVCPARLETVNDFVAVGGYADASRWSTRAESSVAIARVVVRRVLVAERVVRHARLVGIVAAVRNVDVREDHLAMVQVRIVAIAAEAAIAGQVRRSVESTGMAGSALSNAAARVTEAAAEATAGVAATEVAAHVSATAEAAATESAGMAAADGPRRPARQREYEDDGRDDAESPGRDACSM